MSLPLRTFVTNDNPSLQRIGEYVDNSDFSSLTISSKSKKKVRDSQERQALR
jgi:hypothetical protein